MSSRGAIGRADLLSFLAASDSGDLTQAASCMGFEWTDRRPGKIDDGFPKEPVDESNKISPPGTQSPTKGSASRTLEFLLPIYAEQRDPEAVVLHAEAPPETEWDDFLKVPSDKVNSPSPLLAPWARLAGFVRHGIGKNREGRPIDSRRLIRGVATGKPLTVIPHLHYMAWAPQAVLILDGSDEMTPFLNDLILLRRRLIRERGCQGLRYLWRQGIPARKDFAGLPNETVILAVSAMGQLARDRHVQQQWLRLGSWLRRRDHSLSALIPCPRQRWCAPLSKVWRCAMWDRWVRLPRGQGLRALKNEEYDSGGDALLRLLAPATLIEPGLLRSARLAMGASADVAAEYDAWFHADCWQSLCGFGFRSGKALARLEMLKSAWDEDDIALRDAVSMQIKAFHKTCSRVIEVECRMRMAYCAGAAQHTERQESETVVQKATQMLRVIAGKPEGEKGRITGLPHWMLHVVDRIPAEQRRLTAISRGLAQAHHYYLTKEINWPEGIDKEAALEELKRLMASPGRESVWSVVLTGSQLQLIPEESTGTTLKDAGLYLCSVGARRLLISFTLTTKSGNVERFTLCDELIPKSLDPLSSLSISTDTQALYFKSIKRPEWARCMGYDQYGLYADLEVNGPGKSAGKGVRFRLRWIPPGLFWMGAGDERHEVTHTKGFWLAETQTTQALWKVVVGNQKKKGLAGIFKGKSKNPSHFQDNEQLPVETVSWDDCMAFCDALGKWVPDLSFSLPTEAQWEYACRAGTGTDFNNGSDDEAVLSELGWYRKNSEINGKGQTHRVGQKLANAWGLFDMHGNVDEWCLDGLRPYSDPVDPDPTGPLEKGAWRVVRGGSWNHFARHCRSAFRYDFRPDDRDDFLGFRLAAGQKQGRGAVGLWAEGAAAPWPWDKVSANRPTSVMTRPLWAEDIEEDEYGVLAVFAIRGVRFVFRKIKPGTFRMGSPNDENGRRDDEGPCHEVTLTKGYWVAMTPTTQAQWAVVMGDNPSNFKGNQRPVERVSWLDCVAYNEKLNRLVPGLKAALPTEAQWEYACRAGNDSAFNDGSDCTKPDGQDPALDRLGWYWENSGQESHLVGKKQANALGLYDMHGNVREWCIDGKRTYDSAAVSDPVGPTDKGAGRVVRGGSWYDVAGYCRSAFRIGFRPDDRNSNLGFRLAAGQEQE